MVTVTRTAVEGMHSATTRSKLSTRGAALLFLSLAACGDPSTIEDSTASVSQALSAAQSGPSLGSASGFAVLGASTVTCTNASDVTGDVGVSPGSAITGFKPDCTISGALRPGDAPAAQAHNDLVTAYNDLKAVACEHNLTGTDLGGLTLAPGVYCFDSSVGLTGDLTLDGGGDANAVWIFQIGSTMTTATDSAVVMSGSGSPCNVFWQVGSSAAIGVGTAFQGNVLALASITLVSGTSLVGRALALNAAVTMDGNNVSLGECAGGDTTPDAGTEDAGTEDAGMEDDCDRHHHGHGHHGGHGHRHGHGHRGGHGHHVGHGHHGGHGHHVGRGHHDGRGHGRGKHDRH